MKLLYAVAILSFAFGATNALGTARLTYTNFGKHGTSGTDPAWCIRARQP
jgi:hypothetical protein